MVYRCSTRSLISCVRPWFQNCVPIYPQVRRATFILSWSVLPHLGQRQMSFPSCSLLPKAVTPDEVIQTETLWKKKLLTYEPLGMNAN